MSIVVVLHHPRDLLNIAAVVRAMKNFGLRDLRLVSPREYDAYRIEGIAHNTGDVLRRTSTFESLDLALADCTHVAGLTARQRSAKQNVQRPREAAAEILAAGASGRAAVVLGPEDRGLTNDELDRCHRVVTIPTAPDYASLNLAQALAIMAYELFAAGGTPVVKPPRRRAAPATREQLERLFHDGRQALEAIDFFKTRRAAGVMRTVRSVAGRVPLDAREVALMRAMCLEVLRYLERTGRS